MGTPNGYFLNLIRECRLPPSLIKKLGLEFPRARVFKRYSKVPPPPTLDRSSRNEILVQDEEDDCEDDDVKTGKGHTLSDAYFQATAKNSTESETETDTKENSGNVHVLKYFVDLALKLHIVHTNLYLTAIF